MSREQTADRIRKLVEGALTAKGISGRKASLHVAGHDGLIRDIKMGRLPGIDKLEVLFDYLDLEFYFGPRRLDEIPAIMIGDNTFAAIPVWDVEGSAGHGSLHYDDDPVGEIAFRRAYLAQINVSCEKTIIVRVKGDSMMPTLLNGALAMIDQSASSVVSGRVYLIDTEDGLRIKRVYEAKKGYVLHSDNPAYPVEKIAPDPGTFFRFIGEVVWSAVNWREDPATAPEIRD